jgi:hypothetical protein
LRSTPRSPNGWQTRLRRRGLFRVEEFRHPSEHAHLKRDCAQSWPKPVLLRSTRSQLHKSDHKGGREPYASASSFC